VKKRKEKRRKKKKKKEKKGREGRIESTPYPQMLDPPLATSTSVPCGGSPPTAASPQGPRG
jgi:hypothetical protein